MPKTAASDRAYLELKNGKWRVTMAVPRHLQAKFGTRLKQPLGTDSLAIANRLKWPVVAQLKARMVAEEGGSGDPLLREALQVARLRRQAAVEELEDIDHAIVERSEQIAGPEEEDETATLSPARKRARQYADVATGRAVPVDLHYPDYSKQIATRLTRRTVADDVRAIRFLRQWCEAERRPFMLHEVTRRTATQFMDGLEAVSGAPSPVTHRKYLTRLSCYWAWMLERDIVAANPWAGLRPSVKPTPHDEKERPFTDAEMRALLDGPAKPAMHDLIRVAALTGARLDAIVDLRVRDCGEGAFTFKPQKKERGPRRVPIHSALVGIVEARCDGRGPEDPVFPEWPAPGNPKSQRERSFKASNAFTAYRRSVGVDEVVEGRRRALVNFHSFRRWFITKAEQAGQPESIIAWVVGHSRPGMTLGRYSGGPKLEQLRECVDAVMLRSSG